MARIPEEVIERLKEEVSLARLVELAARDSATWLIFFSVRIAFTAAPSAG